jgi:Uncharacterised nucleotidyltransferase
MMIRGEANAVDPMCVWTLLADAVTAEVTEQFDKHEIGSVLLKGAAFAQLLYGGHDERLYTDSDLLVAEQDRAQAEKVLESIGFVRTDHDEDWLGPAPKYAHTFQRFGDGAYVDLHWRLSGAAASPDQQWAAIGKHRAKVVVSGREIDALDPPATALLAALHNAHHGTGRPATLGDLDRAIDRFGQSVWIDAARLADEISARMPFAAGLRLTSAGDSLADRLSLDRPQSVEMWLKTNPSTYGAHALDRFAQTKTLRGRVEMFVRIAFPPGTVMRRFFPLARRGTAGLAVAYLVRPLHLLITAGPALREWHHARRALHEQRRLQ